MKNYYTISELCIDPSAPLPYHVADKLVSFHIVPMNAVREKMGIPVWASQKSGYRHHAWEISRGRSGNSPHTFKGKGAIDWTSKDLIGLFVSIFELTGYTRIAVYPKAGFIHCDYASDTRGLFISDNSSNWRSASYDQVLKVLTS